MKKKFTKLSLLSLMLLSFVLSSRGQTFSVGTGTASNTNQSYPAPFGQYYTGARHQMMYRKAELKDSGAVNGIITQFGLNVTGVNGAAAHLGYTVKMGQTSATSLTAFVTTGMTTVFTSTSYQPVSGWNMHTLSSPFTLDTSLNLIVEVCFSNGVNSYSYNASTQWTTGLPTGTTIYNRDDATGNGCPNTAVTTSTTRPNAKFTITPGVSMSYSTSFLTQNNSFPIIKGGTNQEIMRIAVVTTGNTSPVTATQFNLSTNGTSTPSFIGRARIFYTATNPNFDTLTPFGATLTPSGSYTITGTRALAPDTNYFWLTYDVTNSATTSSVFDAECSSVTVASTVQTISPSSITGNRILLAPLSGSYLVGQFQTFLTIQDIADALFYRGVSANTTFYLNDATFTLTTPVTFNTYANPNNFLVTIKPNTSTTPLITGAIAGGTLIKICTNNIKIDGSNLSGGVTRNLTLSNTSTTSPITIAIQSSGTTILSNNSISNCNIINGAQTSTALVVTDINGAGGYFLNTTLYNNLIQKAYIGIYVYSASLTTSNIIIDSNTIVGSGVNQLRLAGIYAQGVVGGVIRNNTVGGFENVNNETKQGIWLATGAKDIIVERNRITNIGVTATGNTGLGIRVTTGLTGANISIRNNMIDSIFGTGTTTFHSVSNPSGIALSGTQTGIQIVYNTIKLGGNILNGSAANSACIRLLAGSVADVRNNYLYNKLGAASSGIGTYSIALESAASQLSLVNSNNYFSAATGVGVNAIGRIAAVNYLNISSWKSAVSADANSFSENTPFVSLTDPHITPFITTQMEASAIPISGITTDFDGDTRSTSTPDIGADEFTGFPADLTPPGISYTLLQGNSSTTTRVVNNITITDLSGVDVSSTFNKPRIYYKKSSEANVFLSNFSFDNGWKYVVATNSSSPFSFTIDYSLLYSTLAVGDTIQYFVVAQDLASSPNVGANPSAGFTFTSISSISTAPTTPNFYKITQTPLSGNYNIDASQTSPNYTTITSAINDLNNRGVSGPVTFSLTSTSYTSSTETFPLTINEFIGASATNTVTIKPAASLNVTITGNSANGTIKLNGADFVVIEGSNNGTTSRNLTITSSVTGTCIWISSLGIGAGATKNTIKNVNITASAALVDNYGINITGTSTTADGDDNDNNNISFNRFNKMYTGIFVRGTTAGIVDSLTISNNLIGSDTAASLVDYRGIDMARVNASIINSNTIYGMVSATTQKAAIELNGSITNTSFINNTIRRVEYVGTGGWAARGISVSTGTGNNNVTIANNMITGVLADAYGTGYTYQCIGILLNGGANYNLHFNTINLSGQRDNSGISHYGACLWIEAGVTTGVSLRNNILVNTQTSINSVPGYNHDVFVNGTGNPFTTINHNLYNSTTSTPLVVTPVIGRLNGIDYTTLAAWKTITTQDLNSTGVTAVFTSSLDAHLAGTSVGNYNLKGSPISGITTDLDGQTRNVTFPYMGADEIPSAPLPVKLAYFDVKKVSENVQLNWITVNEINNKGFEVQRSIDGQTFVTIDFIRGVGNSNRNSIYNKTDMSAFAITKVQKLFYRLNQIDFDGKSNLTEVKEVAITDMNNDDVKVYPNPFTTDLIIETLNIENGTNIIQVIDISGRVVINQTFESNKGISNVKVNNTNALAAGVYFVKVTNSGVVKTIKIVKQ